MNYREEIRQAISCPQFGDKNYGDWGALNFNQRKLIKRLLDELDVTDEFCKSIMARYLERNEKLQGILEELKKENDDDCTRLIGISRLIDRLEEIIDGEERH